MYLSEIVEAKKKRLPGKRDIITASIQKDIENSCTKKIDKGDGDFYKALHKKGLSIIGEIKKASPSKGLIREEIKISEIVSQYNVSVDSISVLTEEDFFLGSPEILREVVKYTKIPVLMKDFIIDPVQIYEAKYLGAKAILLIANILEKEQLKEFFTLANNLGLDSLVEVHNESDLEKAMYIEPGIIGINNRNLETFEVELSTTERIGKMIPEDVLLVSESGISSIESVSFFKDCRIDGILVGEAFMRASSIIEMARSFKDA